jgi:hypothetical protein
MESIQRFRLLNKLLSLIVFLIFIIVTSSCNDEDMENNISSKLTGTWQQISRTVDGVPSTIDSTRLIMQINSDKICVLHDSSYAAISTNKILIRSGWDFSNGLLNIAVDLPASWTVNASDNSLGMERIDFKQDGTLAKTSLNFERIATIIEQE